MAWWGFGGVGWGRGTLMTESSGDKDIAPLPALLPADAEGGAPSGSVADAQTTKEVPALFWAGSVLTQREKNTGKQIDRQALLHGTTRYGVVFFYLGGKASTLYRRPELPEGFWGHRSVPHKTHKRAATARRHTRHIQKAAGGGGGGGRKMRSVCANGSGSCKDTT